MAKSVTVSAPGKAHLIGEHAVVGGEPAIIGAVGRRLYLTVSTSKDVRYADERFGSDRTWPLDDVRNTTKEAYSLWSECAHSKPINFGPLGSRLKANQFEDYLKAAIGQTLRAYVPEGELGGVTVRILNKGGLPSGSGLGSSSALAVSLAKAVADVYGKTPTTEELNSLAFSIETLMHGTPSGGDNTASTYGGLIWFRKATPTNEIKSLRGEVPYSLENFALVYTGKPEKTTLELVQLVREKPEFERRVRFRAIGEGTTLMLEALKRRDYDGVRRIMGFAQENLAALGVSTPAIDALVESVKKVGGAAKLVGAGGGGMVLAQADDKGALLRKIRDAGYEPLDADFGVEGVRLE